MTYVGTRSLAHWHFSITCTLIPRLSALKRSGIDALAALFVFYTFCEFEPFAGSWALSWFLILMGPYIEILQSREQKCKSPSAEAAHLNSNGLGLGTARKGLLYLGCVHMHAPLFDRGHHRSLSSTSPQARRTSDAASWREEGDGGLRPEPRVHLRPKYYGLPTPNVRTPLVLFKIAYTSTYFGSAVRARVKWSLNWLSRYSLFDPQTCFDEFKQLGRSTLRQGRE